MYSQVTRTDEYINALRERIATEYGLVITDFTPTKRSFYGENWKMTVRGKDYFVKMDDSASHKETYARSFAVVDYIHRQGIHDILKILKTADGRFFIRYEGAVVGIFDFEDGISRQDYPLSALFDHLAAIYAALVHIGEESFPVQKEDFIPREVQQFRRYCALLAQHPENKRYAAMAQVFSSRKDLVDAYEERALHYAGLCQGDASDFYLTHGDAGGNVIIRDSTLTLIDWDNPLLAPAERDAWFFAKEEGIYPLVHQILATHGISYSLRKERMGFYAFNTFFSYCNELITCFLAMTEPKLIDSVLHETETFLFGDWIFGMLEANE